MRRTMVIVMRQYGSINDLVICATKDKSPKTMDRDGNIHVLKIFLSFFPKIITILSILF